MERDGQLTSHMILKLLPGTGNSSLDIGTEPRPLWASFNRVLWQLFVRTGSAAELVVMDKSAHDDCDETGRKRKRD
jgi:hypothetical protein